MQDAVKFARNKKNNNNEMSFWYILPWIEEDCFLYSNRGKRNCALKMTLVNTWLLLCVYSDSALHWWTFQATHFSKVTYWFKLAISRRACQSCSLGGSNYSDHDHHVDDHEDDGSDANPQTHVVQRLGCPAVLLGLHTVSDVVGFTGLK